MFKKLSDKFSKGIIYLAAFLVTALMAVMMIHIVKESIPAISQLGIKIFLPTTEWRPVSQKPQYGLYLRLPVPFMSQRSQLSSHSSRRCLCLLSGLLPSEKGGIHIPCVHRSGCRNPVRHLRIYRTYGSCKAFATHLHMAAGQCILAAGIVLGIMLLPFVISTCHESLQTARKTYEFSAITLGFSREFTLLHFILPAIRPGIIAGAMMAFGRALGETMAVMMVIGNSPIYPKLLGRGQTLPALTALEMGSIEYGSLHLSVLYVANAVLLVILFIVLGISYLLKRRLATHEN